MNYVMLLEQERRIVSLLNAGRTVFVDQRAQAR